LSIRAAHLMFARVAFLIRVTPSGLSVCKRSVSIRPRPWIKGTSSCRRRSTAGDLTQATSRGLHHNVGNTKQPHLSIHPPSAIPYLRVPEAISICARGAHMHRLVDESIQTARCDC
jgi:hypothetical protein